MIIFFAFLFTLTTLAQRFCHQSIESNLNGVIVDVLQVNDKISFLRTDNFKTYRTGDGGLTWQAASLPKFSTRSKILKIMKSQDSSHVFFQGASGEFWSTNDDGETYSFSKLPNYEYWDVIVHPTKSNWLAAAIGITEKTNCHPDTQFCFFLYFSFDSGLTWQGSLYPETNITGHSYTLPLYVNNQNPINYSWGKSGSKGHSDKEFVALFANMMNTQYIPNLFATDDEYTTVTQPFGQSLINSFEYIPELGIFVLVIKDLSGGLQFYTASDNLTETSKPLLFPAYYSKVMAADFLSINSDSSFVSVSLKIQNPNSRNLLKSDLQGLFKESLQNVYYSTTSKSTEFFRLSNSPKILFANHWNNTKTLQTVVSYDNGDSWCPSMQIIGEALGGSSLRILESPYKSGYLIAHGSITNANDLAMANLSVSLDFGKTWRDIFTGDLYFTINNNFIFITERNVETTYFSYLMHQDSIWNQCPFISQNDDRSHTVVNIRTDLAGSEDSLWITTKWVGVNETGYSLFYVNVTVRPCNDNDYEVDPAAGQCLYGVMPVRRRILESTANNICLPANETESCNCTRIDYACASCFKLNENNVCVFDNDNSTCSSSIDIYCLSGVDSFPAYRRVENTGCINDLEEFLKDSLLPCPDMSSRLSVGSIVGLVFGLIIGISLIVGIIVYFKRDVILKSKTFQRK